MGPWNFFFDKQGMGKGTNRDQGYPFRRQKGTFPDYNNFSGMKRGQFPVDPFFRGGEGDGTFNGFVLSNSQWLFRIKIFSFHY
jgi:hypothetical protein